MKIRFIGATGTVTGSKFLVDAAGTRLLVDCGLFQGWKPLRQRNWAHFPFEPASVKAVLLTHAHIDHSGALPLLARAGFRGRVHCTPGTAALAGLLLPDAAHLQEEEARYANRHGFSRHQPALPLYTVEDAERALKRLQPLRRGETTVELGAAKSPPVRAQFRRAGHILGASSVLIEAGGHRVLFSGDLGRPSDMLMHPPEPMPEADVLVIESTYGDRRHPAVDPEEELRAAVAPVLARGGVVLIPAFAVGRAQALLLMIARLRARGALPPVPVWLNSPMAADATRLYRQHHDEHRLDDGECRALFSVAKFVNTPEESRALNDRDGPMIIISASGMATGGRVLHHLTAFAPDPRNLILFGGYQAGGTRGAAMIGGAPTVKIHGAHVPVRAAVRQLAAASAHADADELIAWMKTAPRPPKRTFVVHGEPAASDALRLRIAEELGWRCDVPDYLEEVELR